jgi:hypothetical protein
MLAGSSRTPSVSTRSRQNASTPSAPRYRGKATQPPSGGDHSNRSGCAAKNRSKSGRFAATIARLRAWIAAPCSSAMAPRYSLGPASQMVV